MLQREDRIAWRATYVLDSDGIVRDIIATDSLAEQQDRVLGRLAQHGVQGECGPQLNEERDAEYWLQQPGAPKARLANEKPQGETVPYDELIQVWQGD